MDPEDPYSDPDHFQNSIISSFYLFRYILKMSSKSVHKFFSYLVHKHIWQPGSTWSRQWSRLLPKTNHLFFVPFKTFPENFIKIHPWLFELFVFKNYISWIQKIQIMVQITRKIESFLPFTTSSFYHLQNILKISKSIPRICGSLDPDDPDSDLDYSQKLITYSLSHLRHFLKIS